MFHTENARLLSVFHLNPLFLPFARSSPGVQRGHGNANLPLGAVHALCRNAPIGSHRPVHLPPLLCTPASSICGRSQNGKRKDLLDAFHNLGGNVDGTGYVNAQRVKDIASQFDLQIDTHSMLREYDVDGNKAIDFSEFLYLMQVLPITAAVSPNERGGAHCCCFDGEFTTEGDCNGNGEVMVYVRRLFFFAVMASKKK